MLEVAILDNTEQLLQKLPPTALPSVSPVAYQINGLSSGLIYAGDSTVAASLAQTLAKLGSGCPAYLSPDSTKVWFGAPTGWLPPNKAVLFDMSAETVAFDDSAARGLVQIVTDASGTIWAQGSAAGYYGLWKRTGAGTWTQMLSDTEQGAGVSYRAADNTYWFQSSTSNHYLLSNGVATLQSAPTGTLVRVDDGYPGWRGLDAPYLSEIGSLGTAATFKAADGTTLASPPALPMDYYLNFGYVLPVSAMQIRLDATYSVLILPKQHGLTCGYYWLYLYNKTTGVIKYIGSLPPVAVKATVTPTSDHLRAFAAKWSGNGFRLYFVGNVAVAASDSTEGNMGGVMYVDVPFQPNF